jgi:hypothetical protein
MAWRVTEWPYLVKAKPEEAKARVLAAFHQCQGIALRAAEKLELSPRNLFYVIDALKLMPEVEHIRSLYRKDRRAAPLRKGARRSRRL